MPGVTVEASSPALIEKTRTAVTDGHGQYTIIDLRPGTYTVTFTLAGFNTVKRDGIELTGDFTATVNADLKVGGLEETITVSGAQPAHRHPERHAAEVAHQRDDQRAADRPQLPEPQRARARRDQSPLGSQDVGGTGGERYQTLSVHGSRGDQMPLVINGMPYNNMNNTGGGYNTTLVDQHRHRPGDDRHHQRAVGRIAVSGVLSNTIPKEGGNTFTRLLLRQLRQRQPAERQPDRRPQAMGLTRVNSVKKLWDVEPDVRRADRQGQAVVLRRVPLTQARRTTSPACYKNLRPTRRSTARTRLAASTASVAPTARAELAGSRQPAVGGDTWTRGETLNLTWQADQKNKFTFFGHFNQRLVDCNDCSATQSPEAGVYFTHRPDTSCRSTWTNPYTNKLLFEGGFTFYNERWIFGPQPDNIRTATGPTR